MRYVYTLVFSLFILFPVSAQVYGDWHDDTALLIYAPRYFGPTAFPVPELRSGSIPDGFEVEARGEYHNYIGDKTKDLYLRAFIPVVRGRAAIEVRFIAVEDYTLTPETRDERHASLLECPSYESYSGDVVISAFYQLLKSEKWCDIMFGLNLKTASGGRLCDARFTDAATYWFDVNAGKNLLNSHDGKYALYVQAMAGFYCWMTNSLLHRQNDALLYGAGFTGVFRCVSLSSDISGFSGYRNNGDHPLLWRNNLKVEYRRNVLSLRYEHGMKDSLYDTYSVAYIRKF
ncbi:MAG: hypothetical protein LBJ58_03110 [Tannerellaceae bacterium]|jgi:hypothetical protein|nr:hypothetical protein [Tannerellaceae bacterium]